MAAIYLYFRVHQPVALKKITFFEFGETPELIDEQQHYHFLRKRISRIYLPSFSVLQNMILNHRGNFHFSLSLSGILLEQISRHFPRDYDQITEFMKWDEIEMIASPYYHSCASAYSVTEFRAQLQMQMEKIHEITTKNSFIFCNADMSFHTSMAETIRRFQLKGVFFRQPLEKPDAGNSIYHDPGTKNLNLIAADERYSEAFKKGPFLKGFDSKELIKKMVLEISQQGACPILIVIDLDDRSFPESRIKKRMDFIKQFVSRALATGKIDFPPASRLLERNNQSKSLPLPDRGEQKSKVLENDNILQKEAFRYLYSLEQKIKNTDDKYLLFLWRLLQSHDYLQNLNLKATTNRDRTTGKPEGYSPHETYLDLMNALSAIDIYAQKKIDRSADLFHHDSRPVR